MRTMLFLEMTDIRRSSNGLQLEQYVTAAEDQDMFKAACTGQKESAEAESRDSSCDGDLIAKAIGRKGRHRNVDWRGMARLRRALDFMAELRQRCNMQPTQPLLVSSLCQSANKRCNSTLQRWVCWQTCGMARPLTRRRRIKCW